MVAEMNISAGQPLLILVVGLPGSGKSFFARQFAENYKFFYVDTGRYEAEMENLGSSRSDIASIAKKLAMVNFEQALKSFKHIIFEGNLNTAKEREVIAEKAKKAGFGVLTVWVQTDEGTSVERAVNRDRRRADDKNSPTLSQEEVDQLVAKFEKPSPKNELFVVVSGKHDFKSQSVIVLKKIATLYMQKVTQISVAEKKSKKVGL